MDSCTYLKASKILYIFLSFTFVSSGFSDITSRDSSQNSRFRVTNQCDETLWIQQDFKHPSNDPIVVKIVPGMSYDYNIPESGLASTRFWPKSGCNEHGYNCKVGESTAVPEALENNWQKPPFAPDINSKFEATWGCAPAIFNNNPSLCAQNPSSPGNHIGPETWWNGSAVDGYTYPYAVNVINHNNTCLDIHSDKVLSDPGVNCAGLSPQYCPTSANLSTEGQFNVINGVDVSQVNLQWLDKVTNKPTGCFSPCAKLTTAQGSDNGGNAGGWKNVLGGLTPESPEAQMYCCPTPPVSNSQCIAGPAARSSYAQSVAQVQKCNSYTYAYDDAKGLARCGAQTQFELIFCPKENQTPPDVLMTVIMPSQINAFYEGEALSNNQQIFIVNGGVARVEGENTTTCRFSVNDESQVVATDGVLCTDILVDNTAKTITFPQTPPEPEKTFQVQFNFNPTYGVTAAINQLPLTNAAPVEAGQLPERSVLEAFQQNKSASCELTVTSTAVSRGDGELCTRLNIIKESSGMVHIYLPADIPDMNTSSKPPEKMNYVVFGMDPSIYAEFTNQLVTNGSKVSFEQIGEANQINLIAHQYDISANCVLAKDGNQLTIIQNSGHLCNNGLVLLPQQNGNLYIGLPNPLPQKNTNNKNGKNYTLGIAAGMSVEINGQITAWNTQNKSVFIPEGQTTFKIQGNNRLVRECPVTLQNDALSWPNIPACVGVVAHGEVIYFPAF